MLYFPIPTTFFEPYVLGIGKYNTLLAGSRSVLYFPIPTTFFEPYVVGIGKYNTLLARQ